MAAERTPVQAPEKFPFDLDFQSSLFRLLCEDPDFAHVLQPYLQPNYFEAEPLAWAYGYSQRHIEQYGRMPSVNLLVQVTRGLDPKIRPVYTATMEHLKTAPLRDEQWIKDSVLEFVKRNLFARAFNESRELYNSGKVTQAYDLMREKMDELTRATWEPADRSFFFEEYAQREARRAHTDLSETTVPTGFPWLDNILDGGLSLGELAIWIAYAKVGKTSLLLNHGMYATRDHYTPTAHFVFEGSRALIENRYDACFSGELYSTVKRGETDADKYDRNFRQYQMLHRLMVVRGFTTDWSYSAEDIQAELKVLKRSFGFVPKLVIVDYGDLLTGRAKSYNNEYERQKAAFRDLKSLSNMGYAVWTASQAQRPEKDADVKADLLKSRQIADCYEKVRVADFLGSINQTLEEKASEVMRLYAELYRDNGADQSLVVESKLECMRITQRSGLVSPSCGSVPSGPSLGWVAPSQIAVPV